MNDIVWLVTGVSAAVVAWIITQMILKLVRGKREKLQDRMSSQRPTETPANYRSIVLPKRDDIAAGRAMVMSRFQKQLVQAWPNATPAKFLIIVLMVVMAAFMVSAALTQSLTVGVLGA